MKSAIVATFLLILLIVTSGAVGKSQEKVLGPICENLEKLPTKANQISEEVREKSKEVLKDAKKDFENRSFIVEIGIPHEEAEKVHTLMEKAIIFLDTREDAMFLSSIEELRVYLKALKNYGKANLKNIT